MTNTICQYHGSGAGMWRDRITAPPSANDAQLTPLRAHSNLRLCICGPSTGGGDRPNNKEWSVRGEQAQVTTRLFHPIISAGHPCGGAKFQLRASLGGQQRQSRSRSAMVRGSGELDHLCKAISSSGAELRAPLNAQRSALNA